jgi:hypothetical protein
MVWPKKRNFPGICLEGLRKATKNVIRARQCSHDIRTGNFPATIDYVTAQHNFHGGVLFLRFLAQLLIISKTK